jgi:hypothetical protein
MDGDVFTARRPDALVGEANPADALPAFRHAIVTNADCSELEHSGGISLRLFHTP